MIINRIDLSKFWLFLYLPIIDNSPNFITGNTSSNEKHNINNSIKLKIHT